MPDEVHIGIGELLQMAGRPLDIWLEKKGLTHLLTSRIAWRHADDGESIIIYQPNTWPEGCQTEDGI